MESVYHIVTICVNETSWAHVWRLRSRYLGTGYDTPTANHWCPTTQPTAYRASDRAEIKSTWKWPPCASTASVRQAWRLALQDGRWPLMMMVPTQIRSTTAVRPPPQHLVPDPLPPLPQCRLNCERWTRASPPISLQAPRLCQGASSGGSVVERRDGGDSSGLLFKLN
jgi:hypothetical protein